MRIKFYFKDGDPREFKSFDAMTLSPVRSNLLDNSDLIGYLFIDYKGFEHYKFKEQISDIIAIPNNK